MCSAKARGQGHVGLFYETIHLKDRRHIDGPDDASALATLFMVRPRYYMYRTGEFSFFEEHRLVRRILLTHCHTCFTKAKDECS